MPMDEVLKTGSKYDAMCAKVVNAVDGADIMLIDGDSTDPVENAKNFEPNKPTDLILYRTHDKRLYQAGTITATSVDAAEAIRDNFVENGKPANKNNLWLWDKSSLTITDGKLPKNLTLGETSKVILDEGAKLNNAYIDGDSYLHLDSNSDIEGIELGGEARFEDTKTGNLSFDKDGNAKFEPGSATIIASDLVAALNSKLSGTITMSDSEIDGAMVHDSKIEKSLLEDDNFSKDGHEVSGEFIATNSNIKGSVIQTSKAKDSYRVSLNKAKLDGVIAQVSDDSLLVDDSTIGNTIIDTFAEDVPPIDNVIYSSSIYGLTTNKHIIAEHAAIAGAGDMVTNKDIAIIGSKLYVPEGGFLTTKDPKETTIGVSKEYETSKVKPINKQSDAYKNMKKSVDKLNTRVLLKSDHLDLTKSVDALADETVKTNSKDSEIEL